MKRILITGANSYIGGSVEAYLREFPGQYAVETVDMVDGSWRERSFAGFDTVFHVAGIAHADRGRIPEARRALYYRVNRDLAVETANKAKADGVGQFVFMSSANVYGESAPVGNDKMITAETEPAPSSCYGDSKLQAENALHALESDDFRVVILRPPMVYGKGSKGNYPLLSKLARHLPIFPAVENRRSMLYIGNFTEFVRLMIENSERGTFFPQNAEYSNTGELVSMIAQARGRKIRLLRGFTWVLRLLSRMTGLVNKAFGSLTYEQSMSEYKENYRRYTLAESIRLTEEA